MAEARGIPCEVVPAPSDSDAGCDLALVTLPARAEELAAALRDEGVPHGRWPPGDGGS